MTQRRTRLYYGWIQVGALSLTEMTSWGILYYAFSVFIVPMQQELGWSRPALTGAFSLALLTAGIAALPVGRWVDRHGPRLLMTLGSIGGTLLVIAWASVDSLWLFYLIWAAIGVAMAAVLYEPAFVVVANWFTRQRNRALTLLTFGGGLASVVYIPLAEWLVRAQGWRAALLTLALLLALGTIPLHALVLRRRPEDLGLAPDGDVPVQPEALAEHAQVHGTTLHAALRQLAFWYITLAFALVTLAAVAVTVHLIPFLIDRGFGSHFAATAAGAIGLLALPGRLVFTPLGSYVPRRWVAASLFLLQTVALLILIFVQSRPGVWLFVIVFGAGFGAITPARAALVAELFGRAHYGRISSVLALNVTLARSIAPVGAGLLYAVFNSYQPMLWMLAAISCSAALIILLLRESPGVAAPTSPVLVKE